ncbi:hypothetical protein [Maribacter ulvicola]|uniref:Uncharacterized protein n=1 Tax=Maribacter ulvicola TaxID=228959 RepID=A0A1N6YUX6_9FLAO|nr:hypothetical protein [Maribacter ulvicola]SIR18191.1 hypothetical protein SAMN05421797_107149 [Maribacter ulvicola]
MKSRNLMDFALDKKKIKPKDFALSEVESKRYFTSVLLTSKPLIAKLLIIMNRLDNLNLPKIFSLIWYDKAPDIIGSKFGSPRKMYEILSEHPDGFCKSDQLVPLWENNGHELTGYLENENLYISWAYEDGPNDYEVLSNSYKGLLGHIFRSFLYSKSEAELKELGQLFELQDIEGLIDFRNNNEKWEDEIVSFLESGYQKEEK